MVPPQLRVVPSEPERRLRSLFARGEAADFRARVPDRDRTIRAEVLAGLLLDAANKRRDVAPKVQLIGALVEGELDLRYANIDFPVELASCDFASGIRIVGARIRALDLSGSILKSLDAELAEIAGNLILDRCHVRGKVTLRNAHIAGKLSLYHAEVSNKGGVVICADAMKVDGGAFLQGGFRSEGEIQLLSARISGQLALTGARLSNEHGDAFSADGMLVTGNMNCQVARVDGGIRLTSAHITQDLVLGGVLNAANAALSASGMVVDGGMFFMKKCRISDEKCQVEDCQDSGRICQVYSEVSGDVRLRSARINDELQLEGLKIEGNIDLKSASAGVLHDNPDNWPRRICVDGFTYGDLLPFRPPELPDGRLAWLARGEGEVRDHEFRDQPYEQLAGYYRRCGRDRAARRVLVEKLRRRRRGYKRHRRAVSFALDWTVGYGYFPEKVFIWLVAALTIGSIYFTFFPPAPLDPHLKPNFQPVLYTANLVMPIVGIGRAQVWAPVGMAQWVAGGLDVVGWLISAALIAGLTRIVSGK